MKNKIILFAILLCGCGSDSSLEQLQDLKKPAVVFAKHEGYRENILIIKDAEGEFVAIEDDEILPALLEKYYVGDTIN
jgi:hypothetical protein